MMDNFRVFMLDHFGAMGATLITTVLVVALIVFSLVPISWLMTKDLPRNQYGWYGYCYDIGGHWKDDGILTFTGGFTREMTEREFEEYCK